MIFDSQRILALIVVTLGVSLALFFFMLSLRYIVRQELRRHRKLVHGRRASDNYGGNQGDT